MWKLFLRSERGKKVWWFGPYDITYTLIKFVTEAFDVFVHTGEVVHAVISKITVFNFHNP